MNQRQAHILMRHLGFCIIPLGIAASGCASSPMAKPTTGTIVWQDLTRQPVEAVVDSHRCLSPTQTAGVFPAAVSVCRVDSAVSATGTRALQLAMSPPHDVLPWNGAFDPIRGVAEAFPLAPFDLQGNEPTVERIVEASATLDADVLLLYGRPIRLSQTKAEVLGAVYDVRQSQLLAIIHAQAEVPEPYEVERPANKPKGDPSYVSPEYLAERRFEKQAMACLLELRQNDKPLTGPPPEGWLRSKNRQPVEWIEVPAGL